MPRSTSSERCGNTSPKRQAYMRRATAIRSASSAHSRACLRARPERSGISAEFHESSHRVSRKVATEYHVKVATRSASSPPGGGGFWSDTGCRPTPRISAIVRGEGMARGRLPMRKVKKVLAYHFDEGRSARAIALHCGLARRSVALVAGAVRGLGPELAGGPRAGRRGAGGGALSAVRQDAAGGGRGLGAGREGPVRARHDAEAVVGGMARDASRTA